MFRREWLLLSPVLLVGLFVLGCTDEPLPKKSADKSKLETVDTSQVLNEGKAINEGKPAEGKASNGKADDGKAKGAKTELGKNVWLEKVGDGHRVVVQTAVCRRTDMLEQLLCKKNTKEHESILHGDFDARVIHAALNAAKAKEGSPIKYTPNKIFPPEGTTIKVTLQYQKDGKTITQPAQEWIRYVKNKKQLDLDWVFAGSMFFPDPIDNTKPPIYGANDGDVICVANFETAMLDLPVNSSRESNDLAFEAITDRIPEIGTTVFVILEPMPKVEKKQK